MTIPECFDDTFIKTSGLVFAMAMCGMVSAQIGMSSRYISVVKEGKPRRVKKELMDKILAVGMLCLQAMFLRLVFLLNEPVCPCKERVISHLTAVVCMLMSIRVEYIEWI